MLSQLDMSIKRACARVLLNVLRQVFYSWWGTSDERRKEEDSPSEGEAEDGLGRGI